MIFDYLWLDANRHIRTKYKTSFDPSLNTYIHNSIENKVFDTNNPTAIYEIVSKIPEWNYDGRSTGQSNGTDTEIILKPVNCIKHPFLKNAILILCMSFDIHGNTVAGNTRYNASRQLAKKDDLDIWFGLEQEFFFFDKETKKPFHWKGNEQIKQGEYYCGVNRSTAIERTIMETLLQKSLECGIYMSGINQEVAPTQWEYQIGPVKGIFAADQMIFAKYILYRLCEKHGLYASFHPKPLNGNWNGSGCHVNFSTKSTRQKNGYMCIQDILQKMEKDHNDFIHSFCGVNNNMRLTGLCETSNPNIFSYGVGTRDTSVRIPHITYNNKRGYIEDRRPGSSIDYYKTLAKYSEYI